MLHQVYLLFFTRPLVETNLTVWRKFYIPKLPASRSRSNLPISLSFQQSWKLAWKTTKTTLRKSANTWQDSAPSQQSSKCTLSIWISFRLGLITVSYIHCSPFPNFGLCMRQAEIWSRESTIQGSQLANYRGRCHFRANQTYHHPQDNFFPALGVKEQRGPSIWRGAHSVRKSGPVRFFDPQVPRP